MIKPLSSFIAGLTRRPETKVMEMDLKLLLDGGDLRALNHRVKGGQQVVELENSPSLIRFFFRSEGGVWMIHKLIYDIEDPG